MGTNAIGKSVLVDANNHGDVVSATIVAVMYDGFEWLYKCFYGYTPDTHEPCYDWLNDYMFKVEE